MTKAQAVAVTPCSIIILSRGSIRLNRIMTKMAQKRIGTAPISTMTTTRWLGSSMLFMVGLGEEADSRRSIRRTN